MQDLADITNLLRKWREGDREAENVLFAAVIPHLRRLAQSYMKRERKGHTLQATELVDEIYFKLVAAKDREWRSRGHFFAIAGRAMRRYLIDHFRGRPKARFEGLDSVEHWLPAESPKIELAITLDQLLDEMAEINEDWVHVVEMKFFLGLTDVEAADALALKLHTLQRRWHDARMWLATRMENNLRDRGALTTQAG